MVNSESDAKKKKKKRKEKKGKKSNDSDHQREVRRIDMTRHRKIYTVRGESDARASKQTKKARICRTKAKVVEKIIELRRKRYIRCAVSPMLVQKKKIEGKIAEDPPPPPPKKNSNKINK